MCLKQENDVEADAGIIAQNDLALPRNPLMLSCYKKLINKVAHHSKFILFTERHIYSYVIKAYIGLSLQTCFVSE